MVRNGCREAGEKRCKRVKFGKLKARIRKKTWRQGDRSYISGFMNEVLITGPREQIRNPKEYVIKMVIYGYYFWCDS